MTWTRISTGGKKRFVGWTIERLYIRLVALVLLLNISKYFPQWNQVMITKLFFLLIFVLFIYFCTSVSTTDTRMKSLFCFSSSNCVIRTCLFNSKKTFSSRMFQLHKKAKDIAATRQVLQKLSVTSVALILDKQDNYVLTQSPKQKATRRHKENMNCNKWGKRKSIAKKKQSLRPK